MYFKPKIFISSVLSLTDIRDQIKKHFNSVGADVLLYENNLTPSVNKSTYRQDILDADFVIFIIDNMYGQKTESGISGTHEEYEIIKNSEIPMHMYLKKIGESGNQNLEQLTSEISNDRVSYYYYITIKDLLKRIKETTFQIAKEIALNSINKMNISNEKLMAASNDNDYRKGLEIIRDFDDIKSYLERFNIDPILSTAIIEYFEIWELVYRDWHWLFIDQHLDRKFSDIIISFSTYSDYSSTILHSVGDLYKMKTRSNHEISFFRLSIDHVNIDEDKLKKLFHNFIEKVKIFEEEIYKSKQRVDKYK